MCEGTGSEHMGIVIIPNYSDRIAWSVAGGIINVKILIFRVMTQQKMPTEP